MPRDGERPPLSQYNEVYYILDDRNTVVSRATDAPASKSTKRNFDWSRLQSESSTSLLAFVRCAFVSMVATTVNYRQLYVACKLVPSIKTSRQPFGSFKSRPFAPCLCQKIQSLFCHAQRRKKSAKRALLASKELCAKTSLQQRDAVVVL